MMIELPKRGYHSPESSYVDPGEVAGISTRAKHAMDDYNTTVVTLKSGTTYDTSLSAHEVCDLVSRAKPGAVCPPSSD